MEHSPAQAVRAKPKPSAARPSGRPSVLLLSTLAHALLVALLLRLSAVSPVADRSQTTVEFVTAAAPALPALQPAEAAAQPVPAQPPGADSALGAGPAPAVVAEPPIPMPDLIAPVPAAAVTAELATASPPSEIAPSLAADLPTAILPAAVLAPAPRRKPVLKRPPPHITHHAAADAPAADAMPPAFPAGLAEASANAASPAPAARTAAIDPSWRGAVAAWLAAHKQYPEAARESGEEGAVGVRFTVLRNGRVDSVEIPQPSGVQALDHSVRDMLQGQVLPPFPPSMAGARTDVSVTIRFALER